MLQILFTVIFISQISLSLGGYGSSGSNQYLPPQQGPTGWNRPPPPPPPTHAPPQGWSHSAPPPTHAPPHQGWGSNQAPSSGGVNRFYSFDPNRVPMDDRKSNWGGSSSQYAPQQGYYSQGQGQGSNWGSSSSSNRYPSHPSTWASAPSSADRYGQSYGQGSYGGQSHGQGSYGGQSYGHGGSSGRGSSNYQPVASYSFESGWKTAPPQGQDHGWGSNQRPPPPPPEHHGWNQAPPQRPPPLDNNNGWGSNQRPPPRGPSYWGQGKMNENMMNSEVRVADPYYYSATPWPEEYSMNVMKESMGLSDKSSPWMSTSSSSSRYTRNQRTLKTNKF